LQFEISSIASNFEVLLLCSKATGGHGAFDFSANCFLAHEWCSLLCSTPTVPYGGAEARPWPRKPSVGTTGNSPSLAYPLILKVLSSERKARYDAGLLLRRYQITTMVLHPVATSVFFALTSVLTQSSSSTVGLLLVSVHAVASVGVLLAWVMVSWLDPSEEAPDPAPCLKVS